MCARPATPPLWTRAIYLAAAAWVFAHFGGFITQNPYRPEYRHYDEPNWMWVGRLTWTEYAAGRWRSEVWREDYLNWGAASPQLGKYFIGAPVKWYLDRNADTELPPFGNFGDDPIVKTPPHLFYPARLQAAVFMLLVTLLVMDLARGLFGPVAGGLAGVLFALHPYTVSLSFRAMTDTCALFGMTLAIWAAFQRPRWGWWLLSGFGLGWAAATRMNGLLVIPALVVIHAGTAGEERRWRKVAGRMAIAVAAALPVVYLTNPALLAEPIAGWFRFFSHQPGRGALPGMSPGRLVAAIPELFMQTASTGLIERNGWELRAAWAAATALGAIALTATGDSRRRLFLMTALTIWITLILLVPQGWERYYLLGIVPMAICAAHGATIAARLAWPRVKGIARRARELENRDTT